MNNEKKDVLFVAALVAAWIWLAIWLFNTLGF